MRRHVKMPLCSGSSVKRAFLLGLKRRVSLARNSFKIMARSAIADIGKVQNVRSIAKSSGLPRMIEISRLCGMVKCLTFGSIRARNWVFHESG